ncbi:MAG: L-threonylcarbamoyladenylate synthase [Candidatus Didemnitutus sp.]|nr:L-threonylcarbamoyladenylate synthase [Candidatus Didemnitutus sp.]
MQTRVHSPTLRALRRLAAALRRGELVALPTETVYGLAANALDARACRKIFTAKRRPINDPLIVHVGNLRAGEALAEFNDVARALVRAFWPGPLTLVLPKKRIVPAIVTSGQKTVALRSPAHPLTRKILRLARVPLAAPSANPFGYVSPTTAAHVLDGLKGRIPHVLDGGACRVGVESTIVDASVPGKWRILRPGSISGRAIAAALRTENVRARGVKSTERAAPVVAPGMLAHHYSPHTPLVLQRRIRSRQADERTALLYWAKPSGPAGRNVFWLSASGSAPAAARSLYSLLRKVDRGGFSQIVCETAPAAAGELGLAINDRLVRAAGRRKKTKR